MTAEVEVLLCTVPSSAVAQQIARALLEAHLVACVNVLPGVRSLYRWQGAIEEAEEHLLVIKTARDRYEAVEARIRALHPYEVCEVIALDVTKGSKPYLDWVLGETRPVSE